MSSNGIKDRVSIVGMGCTQFGEHFDRSIGDLALEASQEALASAGLEIDQIDAFWLGSAGTLAGGLLIADPLKIRYKPVTHVENFCATGSEAIRNAAYGIASGAYDVVMAIGVEKLKDSGYSGLFDMNPTTDGTEAEITPPAAFSMIVPAYAKRYGIDEATLKDVISRIAWKNHANGAKNAKAQYRKEISLEQIKASPNVAGCLGVMDCSGVSDGAAAAILVRSDRAHQYTNKPILIKGLSFIAGPAEGIKRQDYDFTTFPEVVASAKDAYQQAGIDHPRDQVSLAEVHDCFTPTELVLMEDLGFSERGKAWEDVLAGRFLLDGPQPINSDGGLKSFGHPIGASGLRMMYEIWLQLRGEAGPRQMKNPTIGVTHNLGGFPGNCVSCVSVVGI